MYEVQSTKYKVGNTRYLPAVGRRSTELRKYQEVRDKRREARDPFAVRFLCVSAPLRAKGRKRQVERSKDRETRSKRQEPRDKNQEHRLRLDFFAFLRLCEKKEERDKRREARDKNQETRTKRQEPRDKKQETRSKRQEPRIKSTASD